MIESAIARILVRYIAGALMSAGFLSQSLGMQLSADADILSLTSLAVGGILAIVTEVAYKLSKRMKGEK